MTDHVILLAPAANRVYAGEAARLSAAELSIMLRGVSAEAPVVEPTEIAGVTYLVLDLSDLSDRLRAVLGQLSTFLAAFRRADGLLRPVQVENVDHFDDDLVTIPKYTGKTNEQFTRLLVNVTTASVERELDDGAVILDPLFGRGTTAGLGWTLGYQVAGVEEDQKAVESHAAFLRGYLRRKRIKHTAEYSPVRREGRSLGRRLDVTATAPRTGRRLTLTVFTGDTRQSAALFGSRRFDAVVTDAPYGVVHGSRRVDQGRDRSAERLLADALPIWTGQLKRGGALGISFNTYTVTRDRLTALAAEAGLRVLTDEAYLQLAHRVDASILRDVLVAVRD